MRNYLKFIVLSICSALAILIIAEAICRFLSDSKLTPLLDHHAFRNEVTAEPDPLLGFRLKKGFSANGFRQNSLGFIGPEFNPSKPQGTIRIFCLGGSTTLGAGTESDRYAYPALLQAMLDKVSHDGHRVEVINAGVYGYNSLHTAIRATRLLDVYSPDILIIMDGLNDLDTVKALTLTQLLDLRQSFAFCQSLAHTTEETCLERQSQNPFKCLQLLTNKFLNSPPPHQIGYGMQNFIEKFELFGYRQNLQSVLTHAHNKGIKVLIANDPLKLSKSCTQVDRPPHGMDQELYELLCLGRKILPPINTELARSHGAYLVELQSAFDSIASTPENVRRVWADNLHLTRYGYYLLARQIFNSLSSLPEIQLATGIDSSTPEVDFDPFFRELLLWRPSDGQGWPDASWTSIRTRIVAKENVKDGLVNDGSNFSAWTPADPFRPGRIVLELSPNAIGSEAAFYARVSGGGDKVSMSTSGRTEFTLSNDSGDGLWTPLAGWYLVKLHSGIPVTLELQGENAQVWHRAEHVFFLPETGQDK